MNINKVNELLKKYAECPNCGCDRLGNGKGALIIEDNTFERSCSCGFTVKIEESKNSIKE